MKLKYLFLSLLLVVLPVLGISAEAPASTAAPVTTTTTVTETVTATATKIVNDATDKVIAAVKDGATSSLGAKVDTAVETVKTTTASAVASVKETVDEVAPPKVRGEFASLFLEKVKKYSAAGENAVNKAIDEIQEQTPLVIKEYLAWHLAQNLFYIFITTVGFITLLVIFFKTFPKWLQSLPEETCKYKTTEVDVKQFKYGASGIISGIASVVVLWIILAHLEWYLNSIKIVIAPRVYLIEQVAGFIRQVTNN